MATAAANATAAAKSTSMLGAGLGMLAGMYNGGFGGYGGGYMGGYPMGGGSNVTMIDQSRSAFGNSGHMMSQLGPTLGYGLQDMLGGIFGGGGGTCGLAQTDEADSVAEVTQADADQDLTQVAS